MAKSVSKRKSIRDYLEAYIDSKDAKKIISSSDIVNSKGFDLWSFKKLILLEYYMRPYLNILINRNFKCYFIDFFSSCGANKVESEDIISIGSPILSILMGVIPIKSKGQINRFHKWFFIDCEKDFCTALEKRVSKVIEIIEQNHKEKLEIGKNIKILCGDCNKKINEVINEIKKESENEKVATLAFIDPYTFSNIEWNTWEKLLSLRIVDVIFTFPIQTIERGYKSCNNLNRYLSPSLNKLLDKYKEISEIPERDFENAYAKDIVELVDRSITHYDVGVSVKNMENREIYRITLFSHCAPAIKLTLPFAKELDTLTAKDLRNILDQIKGKLKPLTEF